MRLVYASPLVPLALFAAFLSGSCGDDATEPPVDAGVVIPEFQPEGCAFKIGSREEYIGFVSGKDDVGEAPNIRRVRLGLGGNVVPGAEGRADPATSAAFGWQTDDGTLASAVTWGTTPDPATWPAENRADGVTWLTPAGLLNPQGDERMHEAYVCGLTPATTYYYRVGGGPTGKEVWSDVFSFTTTSKDPNTPVTIAVAGDSRGQENEAWRLIQRRFKASGAALALFSGDTVNFAPDQGEWESWLDLASKDADGTYLTLASLLTLSTHGNHENHTSLFYGNMVLPQDRAKYPAYSELIYSVDVGPVHIVTFDDAGIVAPDGDPAYAGVLTEFLRADLDAAQKNRANVPWIIASHHHGPYSSSSHGDDTDVLRGRAFLTPLWDEYHVNLDIAGHDHNYERTLPITGPADNPTVKATTSDGTVYVICAGAGADAYGAGKSAFTAQSFAYGANGILGFYAMLKATKDKLTIEGYELHADGSDPMMDTFEITP